MGNSSTKKKSPKDTQKTEGQIEKNITTEGSTTKQTPKKINMKDYKLVISTHTQYDQTSTKVVKNFLSQVTIEAPAYKNDDRPPVDIVCCLDVSGSMAGNRISLVRKSIRRLVRALTDDDRLCFITFDSKVTELMPFTKMNEKGREFARDKVKDLRDGSSTNLAGGLLQSIKTLKAQKENDVCAVLMFTDGEATDGITSTSGIIDAVNKLNENNTITETDPKKWSVSDVCKWLNRVGLKQYGNVFQENAVDGQMLINDVTEEMLKKDLGVKSLHMKKFCRELEKIRYAGEGEGQPGQEQHVNTPIVIHTFGYGNNHNRELLEKVAARFDGMYYFMEDEQKIKEGFANCLGGLLSVVAQDIKLSFKIDKKQISNFSILKHDNVTSNPKKGIFECTFGDLQAEENRHVLVQYDLNKIKNVNEKFNCFDVNVEYKNLVRNAVEKVKVECILNRSGKQGELDLELDVQHNRVIAAKAIQDAEDLGDKSKMKDAREVINKVLKVVEKSPSSDDKWTKSCVADLKKTLEGLKDAREYNSYGKYYMAQNKMCYEQERACNFDEQFAAQDCWNTESKALAYERFERSDSEDSACAELDDAFASQIYSNQLPQLDQNLFSP